MIRAALVFVLTAALGVAARVPVFGVPADPRAIALVDQHGNAFHLADLAGSATIVTFVATRCGETCPIADGQFAQLATKLRRDRIAATLLSITLDPAYDTPFVMSSFAKRFEESKNWRFVSGRVGNVRALMHSFGVFTENGADGVPDGHSAFVYVLDRHERLARTLLLSDHLAPEVEAEARAVDAR